MRLLFLAMLLALCSLAYPATEPDKEYLNLEFDTSCPGNNLQVTASAGGKPAVDVELRLVLYEPYQGLRAIAHTDKDGEAHFYIEKVGKYRIYPNNEDYEIDSQFENFFFTKLCPPPPPKEMEISTELDCEAGLLMIEASHAGEPLSDVLIVGSQWASYTQSDGKTFLPLDGNTLGFNATKTGYADESIGTGTRCSFDCLSDDDCEMEEFCDVGDCKEVIPLGDCGRAKEHEWVPYACCDDSACDEGLVCRGYICVVLPPAQNDTNESGGTAGNETESGEAEGLDIEGCIAPAAFIALLSCALFYRKD
jgi:hypothetical protein